MSPGTVYTVVEPRNMVKHPVTGQAMGRFYAYLGRVRVLTVQDSGAIAEIVHRPDVEKRLHDLGAAPVGMSRAEMAAHRPALPPPITATFLPA